MKTYAVVHSDGTNVKIEAEDEKAARVQAMMNKYGAPAANRTWSCSEWIGRGLSVRETTNA